MGDNRTGDGEGDDEEMETHLADVPANVERIAFTVTIYEAEYQKTEFRTGFQCIYPYRGQGHKPGIDPLRDWVKIFLLRQQLW